MEGFLTHNSAAVKMNESLVKYLAGLLDADGSLSFQFKADQSRVGRFYIGLTLTLSSSKAVDKGGFVDNLPELTGMGAVYISGDNNQFKTWTINKRSDIEMIVPRLIKHMVIKAQHWQWLLDTWRTTRAGGKSLTCDERESLSQASKESRRLNRGPIKPKNHPTWAWVAGYLDGDGCYSHRRYDVNGYTQWKMTISAVAHVNDIVVLEFLQKAFGGRIVGQGQSENVKLWVRSAGYQNRDFALSFLSQVARHAKLKRQKIDAMIHHHQQRLSVPGTEKTYCTVEGCNVKAHGNGMCSLHYQRDRKQRLKAVQATV